MVWMYWMAPPPVDPSTLPPADSTLVATPEVQDVPADEPTSLANQALPSVAAADSILAAATQGTERLITVNTDLYEAQFSTKGGTLTKFELKEFGSGRNDGNVQLVDAERPGALGMVFTTPASHIVDTRTLFFEPTTSAIGLDATAAAQDLTFVARLGTGEIRLTYTFTPGSYEVGFQVEKANAATFATSDGYELLWDGAVPFSEIEIKDEAQRSGAFARSGGEIESVTVFGDEYDEQRLTGTIDWIAVKSKFFAAIVIPDEGRTRSAELIGERFGDIDNPDFTEYFQARLEMGAADGTDMFRLYMGPMDYGLLSDYDLALYDMVDFGWDSFEWMTRPLAKYIFIPFIGFFGGVLPNYGLVIILLAVLMKAALFPFTKSSYKSMAKMRELQPRMEAIKEKYADNPQKQQEAMMKMYKETGVNPIGGCLPMLLQYPIIIALWQFLPQSLEIRQQGFLWAADLSAPDPILQLPFTIPFYGDFVAGFTLLMGLSMIVQMRIQMASSVSSNPQMKIFMYFMPVMIFAIFNRFASGLSLYYLCFNVLTAVQQRFINKSTHEEAEAAKEEEKTTRKKKGPTAAKTMRNGKASKNGASKSARKKQKR